MTKNQFKQRGVFGGDVRGFLPIAQAQAQPQNPGIDTTQGSSPSPSSMPPSSAPTMQGIGVGQQMTKAGFGAVGSPGMGSSRIKPKNYGPMSSPF